MGLPAVQSLWWMCIFGTPYTCPFLSTFPCASEVNTMRVIIAKEKNYDKPCDFCPLSFVCICCQIAQVTRELDLWDEPLPEDPVAKKMREREEQRLDRDAEYERNRRKVLHEGRNAQQAFDMEAMRAPLAPSGGAIGGGSIGSAPHQWDSVQERGGTTVPPVSTLHRPESFVLVPPTQSMASRAMYGGERAGNGWQGPPPVPHMTDRGGIYPQPPYLDHPSQR